MADQVKGKLSADGQVKGKLTADDHIDGLLTSSSQINSSLTSNGSVSGSLSSDGVLSGALSVEPSVEGSLSDESGMSAELEIKRTRTVATMLSELGDVDLDDVQDGDVLTYDSDENKWVNSEGSHGGGIWGTITGTLSDQTDLQDALDAKIDVSEKGANNGVATLGNDGKVPSSQLPASDDDIFVATYGVTTFAEIDAAYNAGKYILVTRSYLGTTVYSFRNRTQSSSQTAYNFFSFSGDDTCLTCGINSFGTWYADYEELATIKSPTFTGSPKAPTANAGTNNTQIATTAFVHGETSDLQDQIGDLSDLQTQDKDSLVDAINEVAQSDNSSWGHITGDIDDQTDLQDALDAKADLENGKVPSSQLPSYVDDVLEYASLSVFPATGEAGKIYIALDTNKTYRWSGSTYVEISESLALGETTGTAYEGSKGKANADAIAKAYKTDDTTSPDLDDADTIPFYDDSASAKKNTLWSNIKSKLQTFFDGIYRKKLIATFGGAGSSDAYCLLCTMVVQFGYINGPTEIVLQERGRNTVARLNIIFESASTTDPQLLNFIVIGAQNNYYIVKTAASTWQIYVTKNEPYSRIEVIDCSIYSVNSVSITWNMTNAASVPSGAVQASMLTGVDGTKVAKAGDTMTGTLQRNISGGSSTTYIEGCGGASGLHINKAEGDIYYTAVSMRTKTGGGWAVGNYNNDNLQFSFGTKADIESNTNNVQIVNLRPSAGTLALTSEIPSTYAGSDSAGGKANSAAIADVANLVKYQAGNEINFPGGAPNTCWFNYRNADTGSSAAVSSMRYKFANYSNDTSKTTLEAASFTGNATTASAVKDSGNNTATTFAYSKAGLAYDNYTCLAGWDGYELRAVAKTQFQKAFNLVEAWSGSLAASAARWIGNYGAHSKFIVFYGTWNNSQILAVFPNNGGTPITRLIAGYNTTTSYFTIGANGQWGFYIKNTSSVNMPLTVLVIPHS